MFVVIFVVALLLLSLLIIAYVLPRPLLSLIQSTTGVLFFFQENSLSSQPQEIIEEKMEEEEDSHERSSQVIGKKVVYLTIDDAPSSSTPDILRVLEKYGVSASFFIISGDFVDCAGEEEDEMQEFLEQTEEAHLTSSSLSPSPSPPSSSQQREFIRRVKAISEAGHELCNHTQREEGTAFLDQQTMEESINHCSRTIQTITGKPPRFFRPGSGWFHQSMLSYAAQNNLIVTLGDVYPHDAHIKNPSINSFFVRTFTKNGSIIILHDRPWTIPALHSILPSLIKEGFVFKRLSESNM